MEYKDYIYIICKDCRLVLEELVLRKKASKVRSFPVLDNKDSGGSRLLHDTHKRQSEFDVIGLIGLDDFVRFYNFRSSFENKN